MKKLKKEKHIKTLMSNERLIKRLESYLLTHLSSTAFEQFKALVAKCSYKETLCKKG